MPTIKIIDSIKINMYARDHLPPHFHAIYAEHEELIEIGTLETYEGFLPKKQRKKVIKWGAENQDHLMKSFCKLNPRLCDETNS
jgi:hypothetical protein